MIHTQFVSVSKAFVYVVKFDYRIGYVVAAEKDINRLSTRTGHNQNTVKGNTNSITGLVSTIAFVTGV